MQKRSHNGQNKHFHPTDPGRMRPQQYERGPRADQIKNQRPDRRPGDIQESTGWRGGHAAQDAEIHHNVQYEDGRCELEPDPAGGGLTRTGQA